MAYFQIADLEENWPLPYGMFGKENVSKGVIESLAVTERPAHSTRSIDDAFLDEIRTWRLDLARDIAGRNPSLSGLQLGDVVQRLIIFLRIAEARGLEWEGELKQATEGTPRSSPSPGPLQKAC